MSGSKMSRHSAAIINRQNVCGGVKKAGLVPTIGVFLSSNPNLIRAKHTTHGDTCRLYNNLTSRNPTQRYGHAAVISGM
jgi:hypothetical protein